MMTAPKVLLTARNIRAKKSLGQHFLADPKIAEKIVSRAGIGSEDTVLEIGAGLGALTLPAARRAGRVLAVETDPRLISSLSTEMSLAGTENVTVKAQSILALDIQDVARRAGKKLVVLGNLPYHISTPILIRLVAARRAVSRAVVMLQQEVADRLAAPPGTKDRSRLSILVQYCADVKALLDVSPAAFYPKPRVDSRVVEIAFHEDIPLDVIAEKHLFQIVRAAFGKRRKTLKNALSQGGLGLGPEDAARVLQDVGIDPNRRAETLEVTEFMKLSDAVKTVKSTA